MELNIRNDSDRIQNVPIQCKMTLTIREAAEYSNIGINKIDSLLKMPNCPFVLYIGTRKLVKRVEFDSIFAIFAEKSRFEVEFARKIGACLEKRAGLCYNQ